MRYFMLLKRMTHRHAFRRNLFVMGLVLIIACIDLGHAIEMKIAFSSSRDGNNEIYPNRG